MGDDERICNYCGEGIADDARLYRLYGFDYHESCCERYIREVHGRSDVGFRARPESVRPRHPRAKSAVLQMRDDLDRGTCTWANAVDKVAGVLSDAADRFLTALQRQAEVWLCPDCIAKRRPLKQWALAPLLRELLGNGGLPLHAVLVVPRREDGRHTRSRLTRRAGRRQEPLRDCTVSPPSRPHP